MRSAVLVFPLLAACAGIAAGAWWLQSSQHTIAPRVPGMDRPSGDVAVGVDLRGTTTTGIGLPGNGPGLWPQFRGEKRNGIVTETFELTRDPAQAVERWSIAVGEGYGGPAIAQGRVYLLDYDQAKREDALRCISLTDGREIWRHTYAVDVKRNHGMSRTVPAVDKTCVVTLGPKCHVVGVDPLTGAYMWGYDLVREFKTKVPAWYAGQCPLIVKHENGAARAIIAPAGENALMLAIDLATGQIVWQTPNTPKWTMTHTSITPVEIDGVPMCIYVGSGGVAGIDQHDGKLLWVNRDFKVNIAAVPSPVDLGGGRILLTGGYGAGAAILEVKQQKDTWHAAITKRVDADVFGAEQQTPIFYGGHIFGVRPDGRLACLTRDLSEKWASGPSDKFGLGAYLVADGILYGINDTGFLSTVELRPDQFQLLGKSKVMADARECWGPIAIAEGHMLLRDLTRLACYDMRKREPHE